MTEIFGDPTLQWSVQLALAAMFISAAWHKARDLRAFRATFANYRILPEPFAGAVAPLLPVAEMILGLALLLHPNRSATTACAIALLVLYSAAVAWNLARGRRDIDCGCLGPGHRQTLSEWLLVRNAMVTVCTFLLFAESRARAWNGLDLFTIAAAVSTSALAWSAANQLMAAWPRVRLLAPERRT